MGSLENKFRYRCRGKASVPFAEVVSRHSTPPLSFIQNCIWLIGKFENTFIGSELIGRLLPPHISTLVQRRRQLTLLEFRRTAAIKGRLRAGTIYDLGDYLKFLLTSESFSSIGSTTLSNFSLYGNCQSYCEQKNHNVHHNTPHTHVTLFPVTNILYINPSPINLGPEDQLRSTSGNIARDVQLG